MKEVKESRNRPDVAQRVPGALGSQISWHSAREGGEVFRLTHQPPLPPGMFLVLIFTRGWVDPRAMVRSEGDMSLKNSVTPPGIDPGTVRLVAQRLNHYVTPGPYKVMKWAENFVPLYTNVILTKEYNDTANSEELINATEYLTLNTGRSTKRCRCNRVGI